MATCLTLTYCRLNRKFGGLKAVFEPDRRIKKTNREGQQQCSQYSLNCSSVIASTVYRGSHLYMLQKTKLLGLPYTSFPTYKKVEDEIGEHIGQASKESMQQALKEELEVSPDYYTTKKWGKFKALTISVDMGWQKFASGRLYNSPSGVLHVIGARKGKLIFSFVYRNSCAKYAEVDEMVEKKEKLFEKYTEEEKLNITKKLNKNKIMLALGISTVHQKVRKLMPSCSLSS